MSLTTNRRMCTWAKLCFGKASQGESGNWCWHITWPLLCSVIQGFRGLQKCRPVVNNCQLVSPNPWFSRPSSRNERLDENLTGLWISDAVLNREQTYSQIFWLHFKVNHWFQFGDIIVYLLQNPLVIIIWYCSNKPLSLKRKKKSHKPFSKGV